MNKKIVILVSLLAFFNIVLSQTLLKEVIQWGENYEIPTSIKVGDELLLSFTCKIKKGFHLFSAHQPGDKLVVSPLRFRLDTDSKGVELIETVIESPNKITVYDELFDENISYFDSVAVFSHKVKITSENPILHIRIVYQIITDDFSVMDSYNSNIPLKIERGK